MQSMPADEAALLRAVCDQPEEDAPRLVYADWLQEYRGDSPADVARAEFIRLQVTRAREGSNAGGMTPAEIRLWHDHASAWAAEKPKWRGLTFTNNYSRGFHYHLLASSVRSFLKAAPEVFVRFPITDVRFKAMTPQTAAELAQSPVLARVRRLDQLRGGWNDPILTALAASPHLCNLRRFELSDRDATLKGIGTFLRNPLLSRLKDLSFVTCLKVGPGLLRSIIECHAASFLEEIVLSWCLIGPAAAVDLPELVALPRLRRLSLFHNVLGDAGGIALASARPREGLNLSLAGNTFTDRSGEAFLSGPLLRSPAIKVNLRSNGFSEAMKARLKEAFGDRVSL